jgi:diacylglycerol kinase (ATP)
MSNKPDAFSWKARIKSFSFAGRGIWRFFRTEHNAWIHLAATIAVLILAFLFKLTTIEAICIVFCIAFVWVTEMINTAIEKAMDYITSERHEQIRNIKDMAAGAVLVASITSIVVGAIIFLPKFFQL